MFLIYSLLIIYALIALGMLFLGTDYFISNLRNKTRAPEVASPAKLRAAVIKEIAEHYGDYKTVLEIGSCYGGFARAIALANPDKTVDGVEIMPAPFMISKFMKLFRGPKNMNFKFGDAVKFINKSDGYDIGVTWLTTPVMKCIEPVADRFKVLLVLDFPLPGRAPTRVIKLHPVENKLLRLNSHHMLYIYT
ncbi:MAG: tRNA (guanine-N(7)-)-methyltransferase [Alphaproteobacteria bacterium]|nr:tRNA (guanine-N(7)-)-methyltransferase [Alphaproteobacteria bacterium]